MSTVAREPYSRMQKLLPPLLCFTHSASTLAVDVPYPSRPIRVIIPTAPGVGSDAIVRMLVQMS